MGKTVAFTVDAEPCMIVYMCVRQNINLNIFSKIKIAKLFHKGYSTIIQYDLYVLNFSAWLMQRLITKSQTFEGIPGLYFNQNRRNRNKLNGV